MAPRATRSTAASASGSSKPSDKQPQVQTTTTTISKATRVTSSRAKAADKTTLSAATTTTTTGTKRRLRSTKNEDASPLRAPLLEPNRKKATAKGQGKAPASFTSRRESAGESFDTPEAGQESEDDSGAGIFFSKRRCLSLNSASPQDAASNTATEQHSPLPSTQASGNPLGGCIETRSPPQPRSPSSQSSGSSDPPSSPVCAESAASSGGPLPGFIMSILSPSRPVTSSPTSSSQVATSQPSRRLLVPCSAKQEPETTSASEASRGDSRAGVDEDAAAPSPEHDSDPNALPIGVVDLVARVRQLETKLRSTQSQLVSAQTENSSTRAKLEAANAKADDLEEQKRRLNNDKVELERENSQLENQLRTIRQSEALKLLAQIEQRAAEAPRPLMDRVVNDRSDHNTQTEPQEESNDEQDTTMEDTTMQSPQMNTTNSSASTPAAPTTPTAQPLAPAQSQGLFSFARSFFISPFKNTPAPPAPIEPAASIAPATPSTPARQVAPASPSPLTMTLTQAPTPVGEKRSRTKKKKRVNNRERILTKVTDGVTAEEKEQAAAWVRETIEKMVEKLSKDALLGEKRKRLEKGVKVGDLKTIQATKPWLQGSFGMDDDIGDLSDSEDAPAWAVLQDMMTEIDNDAEQPAAKKRRTTRHDETDEVVSLNEAEAAAVASAIFNSNGHSASLQDLKPRSGIVPSPMFDTPSLHREGNNVFNELQGQDSGEQSAADKRATVSEAIAGETGGYGEGFTVPEDSDEEEDWTQSPPRAPVPAHATLPALDTLRPQDPVEAQRAKALKHTPAKSSRLREAHFPSPSLLSDAGASPAMPMVVQNDMELPDAEFIDFGDDFQAFMDEYVASGKAKVDMEAQPWDDPIPVWDDDDTTSD